MNDYEVFSAGVLVGWSALERGDPSMGVAEGRFFPAPEYASVQARVVEAGGRALEDLQLSVCPRSGESLSAQSVVITDFSDELGESGLEVAVLGVSRLQYAQRFPHHIAVSDRQFD